MNKWEAAARLTGVGFFIVTCIVGGALAGWFFSGKNPVFMIIGLLAGLGLAVVGVYRMLKPLLDNDKKENG